jgi:hypothetical protein
MVREDTNQGVGLKKGDVFPDGDHGQNADGVKIQIENRNAKEFFLTD